MGVILSDFSRDFQQQESKSSFSDARGEEHVFPPRTKKTRPKFTPPPLFEGRITKRCLLEIQFQSELELPLIIGGSGTAVITTIAGALRECIHVTEVRGNRGFVEAIEKVKAFRNHIQAHAFSQMNGAHDPQIERCITVSDSRVTTKIADRESSCRNEKRSAVGGDARAIIGTLQVSV